MSVAELHDEMGEMYDSSADCDSALEHYRASVRIKEIRLGVNHFDVAVTLGNVANMWLATGQPEQVKNNNV